VAAWQWWLRWQLGSGGSKGEGGLTWSEHQWMLLLTQADVLFAGHFSKQIPTHVGDVNSQNQNKVDRR
jgi:hypothetical protein